MKIQNVNLHHSLEYTFRIAINEYVLYIQVIQAIPITAQWLISKNVRFAARRLKATDLAMQ